ncbi:hypothetical protein [Prosthecobacter sp.]|uniref:hypothetical protein n=1 Tax=Prosthecobacter sp. TaxID=1965333 RepID=UPI0037830138
MVSRIEPDRYADTGFSVKDTAPEINAMIFAAMMRKTPEERLLMGFSMTETARRLVWGSVRDLPTESERRREFFRRFYGMECPFE